MKNYTLNSREVAEMVKKTHANLLKDIRSYINQLAEVNLHSGDFFSESNYLDVNGQSRPCYLVTKKGCEFIAHKLTGEKGTKFTATYINRFHEMEDELTIINPSDISLGELASYFKIMDRKFLKIKLDLCTPIIYNKLCEDKRREGNKCLHAQDAHLYKMYHVQKSLIFVSQRQKSRILKIAQNNYRFPEQIL